MNLTLYIDIATKKVLFGKKTGMPSTFSDVHYKLGCSSTTISTTCDCKPTDLFYKVFYPTDVDYNTCALPAVIMFHGGGFADCTGVNDNPLDPEQKGDDVITICQVWLLYIMHQQAQYLVLQQ